MLFRSIVLVRGRLDHKDRGETKLVVQEAERFEPDAAEIAAAPEVTPVASGPFKVEVAEAAYSEALIEEIKAVLEHHKGPEEVRVALLGTDGRVTELKCGDGYRVRPSGHLRSELNHVLSSATALAA